VEDLCILAYTVSLPGLRGKSHRVLVVFGVHDEMQVRNSSDLCRSMYINTKCA